MESLHPMVVHFPIALLTAAFLVETLALFFKKPDWHRVSLWNLILGTVGGAVAVFTGRQAMSIAKHSFGIHQVMSQHERLGYLVLALAVLSIGLIGLAKLYVNRWIRWIAWGCLGLACAGMALGAHLGGRLVYEFGVGGVYGRTSGIEIVR